MRIRGVPWSNRRVLKDALSYYEDRYGLYASVDNYVIFFEPAIAVPQFVVDAFMSLPGESVNMTPNIITSRFEHILNGSGIKHFRFHDLRHYSASIQHALGIPDAYIMQSGGWGNDRVLKEVYRHTLSDAEKKMNGLVLEYYDGFLGKEKFEYEDAY